MANAKIWAEIEENHKKLENAVKSISRAYEALCDAIDNNQDEDADMWSEEYEKRIERYAKRLGCSYNWLEDAATDYRLYGWDYC